MAESSFDNYLDYVRKFLAQFSLRKKHIMLWTGPKYRSIWEQSITHASIDVNNNYEDLEFIGDRQLNALATVYIKKKFPKVVSQHYLSLLFTYFTDRERWSRIMEEQDVVKYIKIHQKNKYCALYDYENRWANSEYRKLLTDIGEAFLGALYVIIEEDESSGVAYAVLEQVVGNLLDKVQVPEPLNEHDLITKRHFLKEIYDHQRQRLGLRESDKDNTWKWSTNKSAAPLTIKAFETPTMTTQGLKRTLYHYEIYIPDLKPDQKAGNGQSRMWTHIGSKCKRKEDASDQATEHVISWMKGNGYSIPAPRSITQRNPPKLPSWCDEIWNTR